MDHLPPHQPHLPLNLRLQQVEYLQRPRTPTQGRAVERGPANQHGVRAQRKGLEHITATSHAVSGQPAA